MSNNRAPVVLVTGAARRIGAAIARCLHAAGWNVVLHAHRSYAEVEALAEELNAGRADSAHCDRADLHDASVIEMLVREANSRWERLDALVNNASSYYPTPLGTITAAQIDELVGSNLRAPLLLTQACAARFGERGAVVNIVDTQIQRPQVGYAPYFAAKAGLWTLTESLALELAPRVRVNAVAPGHMLWADRTGDDAERAMQQRELARIPLGRLGGAEEVARAVRFLLSDDAAYITGAVLPVDGGLRLR
ncbi:MAG: pteridine reductase [Pseudomonadota bacterium]|nr:pteridine reductase [Pseudomonadota bacterium]